MINNDADTNDNSSTQRQLRKLPELDRSEKRQKLFFDDGVMGHTFPTRKRPHPTEPGVFLLDHWDPEADEFAPGVSVIYPEEL